MFLSKLDALTLSKVLFHYDKMTRYDGDSDEFFESVLELSDRITEYLTGEVLDKTLDNEDPHDDEENHVDEDLDDDGQDVEAELPAHTAVISAETLHDLPPVVATRDLISGELEFEFDMDAEDSGVFVLWNGSILHDDSVVRICRAGKSVDLWTFDGLKLSFELKKLNKEWKVVFADGVVYMVD